MPRTGFDRFAQPPVDVLKAPVLERVTALHRTTENLAALMGVSKNTALNRLKHQHTDEWTLKELRSLNKGLRVEIDPADAVKICKALGLTVRKEGP